MANNSFFPAIALIGGGQGALDGIPTANLADNDVAIVVTDGGTYKYRLDATSGATERSPVVIKPDDETGDKRWILRTSEIYIDPTCADQGAATATADRSIKDFVDSIGASRYATLILSHTGSGDTTTYTLTTSVTIPSNITLEIENGAVINIASSKTLTINGSFSAGLYQVFSGDGSVAGLKESNIIWFGAVSDSGTTNNRPAIKAAFASVVAGGKVIIPYMEGYYKYDNDNGLVDAVAITQAVTVQLDGTIKSTSSTNGADPPYIFNVTGDGFNLIGTGTLQGPGTFVVDELTYDNIPGLIKMAANKAIINGVTFVDPPECAIYIPNKSNIGITHCKFIGGPLFADAPNPQHYYIVAYGGDCHIITDNKFYASATGGSTRQAICYGSSVHATNLTITNNQFLNIHEHATYLTKMSDSIVSNNIVKYNQDVTEQEGQAFKIGGSRNIVDGNQIYNPAKGGIVLYAANDCVISNNVIYDFGFIGIQITNNVADSVGFSRNIIDSNTLHGRTDGETIYEAIRYTGAADTTADCVGGKITNNVVSNVGTTSPTVTAISVYHSNSDYKMQDFDISGNKVRFPKMNSFYFNRLTQSKIDHNTTYNPETENSRMFYIRAVTNCTFEGNIARDDQVTAVIDVFLYADGTDNNYIELINNACFTTGNTANLGKSTTYHIQGRGNRLSETDNLTGTFTMNNVATLTVDNDNIDNANLTNGLTRVNITPLNADAATIMGSSKSLYVSGKVAKTSFTVSTADGTNVPATDAIFAYEIIQ